MQLEQLFDSLRRAAADPLGSPGLTAIAIVILVAVVLVAVLIIVAIALPGSHDDDES